MRSNLKDKEEYSTGLESRGFKQRKQPVRYAQVKCVSVMGVEGAGNGGSAGRLRAAQRPERAVSPF